MFFFILSVEQLRTKQIKQIADIIRFIESQNVAKYNLHMLEKSHFRVNVKPTAKTKTSNCYTTGIHPFTIPFFFPHNVNFIFVL